MKSCSEAAEAVVMAKRAFQARVMGLLLFFCAAGALLRAHPVSISYSHFDVQGDSIQAVLRLPLEELDLLMQLDQNLDNQVSLEEAERARGVIEEYLVRRVRLSADGANISGKLGSMQSWKDSGGFLFLELDLSYRAPKPVERITMQVDLLTDLMPAHKNLSQIRLGNRSEEFVFEGGRTYTGDISGGGFWKAARTFLILGIEHIFTGYDHIVFLFGLLIVGSRLLNLIKIVSSFTVAHSITLALATLGLVTPVAWMTEAGIALSIAYIGFENLFIREVKHRWKITFVFGLIHGFGFANILRAMNLPRSGLAASLFTFNLGVEMGQVTIVALMFPLLYYVAQTRFRLTVTRVTSLVILGLGLFWLYQRVT
ncbi:MAG: HupE/UreJ family protein [Acidobacteria bacterium]|nr:HupE/UreJ family protein [Acidobacteriota bacterium]